MPPPTLHYYVLRVSSLDKLTPMPLARSQLYLYYVRTSWACGTLGGRSRRVAARLLLQLLLLLLLLRITVVLRL
jgi:hypothetical protein